MQILVVTNSPAKSKTLSTVISSEGHIPIWRYSIPAAKKEIERCLWTLDLVICTADQHEISETIAFLEWAQSLKEQRGYHVKPYCSVLLSRITNPIANQVRLTGAFVLQESASVEKLLAHDGPAYALAIFSYEANVTHVRSRGHSAWWPDHLSA